MRDFLEDLLIIIVLYNTSIEDSKSFQSILKMVEKNKRMDIFVYDNSPRAQQLKNYYGMSIKYIHNALNPGISKAYNEGASYGKIKNKKWMLLLDQDTRLPKVALRVYKNAVFEFTRIKLFAPILLLEDKTIFSPCKYKFKRGFSPKRMNDGTHSLYDFSPVNSGILVNTDAFISVGGYNENVKLDFSDFQFIERFRKKHETFNVLDIRCLQDFSNNESCYESQLSRFIFFCDGAKNFEKNGFFDEAQYFLVVFLRALKLSLKYRNFNFFRTAFRTFLK